MTDTERKPMRKSTPTKTGTREWSDHSANCIRGCAHGCLYCYARAQALRFRQIARGEDWTAEKAIDPGAMIRRWPGRVMFPTQHDVTPENWEITGPFLAALLRAGNKVLLVTKGHREVAGYLGCAGGFGDVGSPIPRAVLEHRLEVRVTIGSLDDDILRFWEPGAPTAGDRFHALMALRVWGIPTSVSVEPLLDVEHVQDLVEAVALWTTGEIWIGAANKLRERTAWCRGMRGLEEEILRIEAGQTPERMREVYEALRNHPQVRWKDSYQKALGIDAAGKTKDGTP